MAMSLSISRLKQDNILVKNHESIQKAAIVTDICVSKTGVLTSALLSVSKFFMGICVDGANDNAQDSDTNWQRK
jgi:magnesium-transporting ATPase (P-type)